MYEINLFSFIARATTKGLFYTNQRILYNLNKNFNFLLKRENHNNIKMKDLTNINLIKKYRLTNGVDKR